MSYSPQTRRQLAFAAMHLGGFLATVLYIHTSSDSQAGAIWLLWGWIDIPWSALYFVAGPQYSSWLGEVSSRSVALAHLLYLPHIIHGVIGTIWWYFVPALASHVTRLTRQKSTKG